MKTNGNHGVSSVSGSVEAADPRGGERETSCRE